MEHVLYCQSCGMPLETEEVIGTDAAGAKMEDYCIYCYEKGAFTVDATMDEMIQISLDHMKELFQDDPNYNAKETEAEMRRFFPELKRWKRQ